MEANRPNDRLGVALAGLGSVGSTLAAGVFAARRDRSVATGSLTELRDDWRAAVTPLEGLRFAAWDVHDRSALEVARGAGALSAGLVESVAGPLEGLRPRPGAFEGAFLPGTEPRRQIEGSSSQKLAALRADLRRMRQELEVDRLVVLWSGSTEAIPDPAPWTDPHSAVADDQPLPGSILYALAALEEGLPFVTLSPGGGLDLPAFAAAFEGVAPVAGSDLKTGQTWLKAALAEAIADRLLGVDGWFSLNLLGNEDGRTLTDPGSYARKQATKRQALEGVLDGERWPDLYGALQHEVRIAHYAPRGDAKEAWDTIDLRGWGGRRMQLKLDLLGWDSALAAPLALDLVRLVDLAARRGRTGVQSWLGWYFKAPAGDAPPRLSEQRALLERTVAELAG